MNEKEINQTIQVLLDTDRISITVLEDGEFGFYMTDEQLARYNREMDEGCSFYFDAPPCFDPKTEKDL